MMSRYRSTRKIAAFVALAGLALSSCVTGDVGFRIVITNPCDREVVVQYWDDRDPGPGDSMSDRTEVAMTPGESFELDSIGEDFEVVVSSEELSYLERRPVPEPGGTIVFDLPLPSC